MSQQTFWLSPTPEQPSRDWTTPFPRICTWCELQPVASPEKPVRVYNTHLDHISYFARVRGLREILRHISTRYQQAPGPVLLMGDFNATPTSQTLRQVELRREGNEGQFPSDHYPVVAQVEL